MLKEHTSKTNLEPSTSDDVIEPDTFWKLIEKLLLRSSVDAQARNQHNLALSALCRGHALPCLPRHPKGTKVEDPKTNNIGNKLDLPNIKTNSKKDVKTKINGSTKSNEVKSVNSNQPSEMLTHTGEESEQTNTDTLQDPTKAQSECFVNQLDIVCVTDTKIPASERLWRYAMKHSKTQTDSDEINQADFIPKVRSNEAIYHALKQRLDAALSEKGGLDSLNQKKKTKKRKSTKAPRTCKSVDRHGGQWVSEPKPQTTPKPNKSTPLHIKSVEKILTMPKRRRPQSFAHELRNSTSNEVPVEMSSPSDLGIQVSPSKHEKIESNRALYDCVLKKRLSCGNQLETLNKEIVYKKHNPRSVINREMTKKYAELKNEYLNLCYQECNLRHQMAILHAEIYMMQNKGYHKTPASIKTINLDSSSANLRSEMSTPGANSKIHKNDSSDVLLFPRLKAQKPLLCNQQRHQTEKYRERIISSVMDSDTSVTDELTETPLPYIMDGFGSHGVCSIYSLSPQLAPPPKRTPIMTIEAKLSRDNSMTELSHRLPKLSTLNLLKATHKN